MILSICLVLFSCDKGSDNANTFESSLLKINTQYWDVPSKQVMNQFLKSSGEKVSDLHKQHLSEILIEHNNPQLAIPLLQQLDIYQNQYLAYLLVTAYYNQDQLEKALNVIEKGSWQHVKSSLINFKYKLLLEMGQAHTLINLQSNANTENESFIKYFLAMAYLQNGNCEKSIPLLKRVIHKNAYANKIYVPLTHAYQQCGFIEEARQARKKQGSIALSNKDVFANRLLKNGNPVSFYNQSLNNALAHNNTKEIISSSEKLIKYGSTSVNIYNNYGISLYKTGHLKSANKAFYNAIKLDDKNVKSYQMLFEFNRNKNVEIAKKAIDKLIEIDPKNAMYQQAKKYLQMK